MSAKLQGRVAEVSLAATHVTTGMAQGTMVLTIEGVMPVEYLAPGDRIITRDGIRVLVDVNVEIVTGEVVRICASSLGHARPEEDVVVAADQAILIRDWRAKALYGAAQAIVPVRRLLDGELVRIEKTVGLRMYSLQFTCPQVVYAGALEVVCQGIQVNAEADMG